MRRSIAADPQYVSARRRAVAAAQGLT